MTEPVGGGLLALRDRPMVFVDDLAKPELSAEDQNHLERALRVSFGAPITIGDGNGSWRPARFGPAIEPDGEVVIEKRQWPPLTVGFAPVKGDRSDLIVQKLTELGVDEVVPLVTERSVVRWDERRAVKNHLRHVKIAREAAMQSRNPWLPRIGSVTPIRDVLTTKAARSAQEGEIARTVMADPAGQPLEGVIDRIVIGPEGGFSPSELQGQEIVGLPGRILRTETAAIVAAVLAVNARRG